MITFDGPTLTISFTPGSYDVGLDLYNAWKQWAIGGNLQYPPAFYSSGGQTLTDEPGVAPCLFFLRNDLGWRLSAPSPLVVLNGNLYAEVIDADFLLEDANFDIVRELDGVPQLSVVGNVAVPATTRVVTAESAQKVVTAKTPGSVAATIEIPTVTPAAVPVLSVAKQQITVTIPAKLAARLT